MRFEWDEQKAKINLEKHGVSFDEARTVFEDINSSTYYDKAHSSTEDRYIIIGLSQELRMLVVVHCERDEDVIRIISARKASPNERRYYAG